MDEDSRVAATSGGSQYQSPQPTGGLQAPIIQGALQAPLQAQQQTPLQSPRPSPQRSFSPGQVSAEAQLVEALTRESQNIDANNAKRAAPTSPDDEDHGTPNRSQSMDYGNDSLLTPGGHMDHKRRKRVFSNRTKTGCLTCRRRKKKCDEAHPECNNCIRGGFVCEGYNSRTNWQKPAPKQPVALQSKEPPFDVDSPEASPFTAHQQMPLTPLTTSIPIQNGEASGYRIAHPHAPRVETQAASGARSLALNDDRDASGHLPMSPESGSASAWNKPGWPATNSTASFGPDPVSSTSRVGPLQELGRPDHDASTPQSAVSHRTMLHPSHDNSPHTPRSAQASAQLALQHQELLRGSTSKTEKEKMLAGEHYFPLSRELVDERERCKAACWQFNNSTNPSFGASREERGRLFHKILHPPGSPSAINPKIRLGENVIVEAPFTCEYGYNITIASEVLIGANCTILDPCSVDIGARCILGPSVSIYTATLPIDPRRRKGSQGPSIGRGITIEEDCWIGGNVTILPGLRIGRSSTVGAGSVVTRVQLSQSINLNTIMADTYKQDVPRFTVVAGNPARVIRGIYSNDQTA
ncbi:MAG: Maltose acetyltransferase [Trizodia sp. TS-e1964]|nr:MAG: Maltose acetyltransferase [Trizodia sp. TS-e1964]